MSLSNETWFMYMAASYYSHTKYHKYEYNCVLTLCLCHQKSGKQDFD